VSGPVTLLNGDDAKLIRLDAALDITSHAHGPGSPGGEPGAPFDWSVDAFVPITIAAHGEAVIDRSRMSHESLGATDAQINETIDSNRHTYEFLQLLAAETEEFWRSGACIDLQPSEESRRVEANERVSIQVNPIQKFDGQAVDAPTIGTFTGVASFEPDGAPVEPGGSFDYVAGDEFGDKGTIELKQTSRRGIGKAVIEFSLEWHTLLVTLEAQFRLQEMIFNFDRRITAEVTLYPTAGQSGVAGSAVATFTYNDVGACEWKGGGEFDLLLAAELDEADSSIVHITSLTTDSTAAMPGTTDCPHGPTVPYNGQADLLDMMGHVRGLIANDHSGALLVPMGEPTTFTTGTLVAPGMTTLTVVIQQKE
jgi:hypothetical protein